MWVGINQSVEGLNKNAEPPLSKGESLLLDCFQIGTSTIFLAFRLELKLRFFLVLETPNL